MSLDASTSVSRLLESVDAPQRESLTRLFPQIYEHLVEIARRQMAQQPAGHTLQPTALVNEAFVRIRESGTPAFSRDHALALAAVAMRCILVDHARGRLAQKRGGGAEQFSLSDADGAVPGAAETHLSILDVDDALTRLASLDERRARVVELRFFGGMTNEETASALGIARSTVAEDWSVARASLRIQLGDTPRRTPSP